jgi:steroid delta-isomerase
VATSAATVTARAPAAIAALFAEDAVQADPADQPPNVGRAAIATFFEGAIAASDGWTFTATDVHTCGSAAAFTFRIDLVAGGAPMAITGVEVFQVDDDGLLADVRAYWDGADVSFPAAAEA